MRSNVWFVAAGCVPLILAIAIGEFMLQLVVSRSRIAGENSALAEAYTIRSAIESEIDSTVYMAIGLSGYLSLDPQLDAQQVERMLRAVFRQGKNVRNIALAPQNRLDYVYPLEGNEAIIGLQYESIPEQWPDVERAINLRETVVAGPIKLIQGGFGIVSRTPVFLDNDEYWGVVSMVIDVDSLLMSAMGALPAGTAEWALRSKRDSNGVVPYTFGNAALFGTPTAIHFDIARGDRWEIAVMPRADHGMSPVSLWSIRCFNIAVGLLVGTLLFLILRERELVNHLADHDTLTGIPNRRLLFERLDQCVVLARRYKSRFCLVYLDLDGFKPINDRYGHHAGDHVLRETATRIRKGIRASDTVARIGGDEFVVMLPDVTELDGAMAFAENLKRTIEEPIPFQGESLHVGASIGIGRYPDHGDSPEAIMSRADKAMYQAKSSGKGRIVVLPAPRTADLPG